VTDTCADYVVVGSGITGATIARQLADAGLDVLVVERRGHTGGNVHDFRHDSGIRIHSHGPHYFRTNSDSIWEFVNRFTDFHLFRPIVYSLADNRLAVWPLNKSYLISEVGPEWKPQMTALPSNFEEASLAMMPQIIYDRFVRGYTIKQWGVEPRSLSKELAGRFNVREDNDQFFSPHKHQGIPLNGYASFMNKLLEGIPRILDCDYLKERRSIRHLKKLIFTGPIDEFFGFRLGRLAYRAQKRRHEYLPEIGSFQPVCQVNNPGLENGPFIRTIEWRKMMPPEEICSIVGTVITREYPFSPDDPNDYEYPFPDEANRSLYQRYRAMTVSLKDTLICGRLGEYRYFDMDQALARALMLSRELLGSS
jgi:UDP-galactopyranose mutase